MTASDTKTIVQQAKRIYAERLQTSLEQNHRDRFVAIEPESGDFFLGDSFDDAVSAARTRHPQRISHTIRIGHRAAFHLGGLHQ